MMIYKYIFAKGHWWRLLEDLRDLAIYLVNYNMIFFEGVYEGKVLSDVIEDCYDELVSGEKSTELKHTSQGFWLDELNAGKMVLINKHGSWHNITDIEGKLVLYSFDTSFIEIYPRDLSIVKDKIQVDNQEEEMYTLTVRGNLIHTKYGIYFRDYSMVYKLAYCFVTVGGEEDELLRNELLGYYGLY